MSVINLEEVFKKHTNFLIATHVNPDPDALASELAMAYYLKTLGKKVTVVNEENVPNRFQFLPGIKMVKKLSSVRKSSFDAAVVVDCGDRGRVGKVEQLISSSTAIINIDHHITNDSFGKFNLVTPEASSTAEVIFDMLKSFNATLTREMAILLYVGILTDTGSFCYENTSSHTHEIVSELLRFKFSVSELYTKLYENIPMNDLLEFAKLVSHFEPLNEGKMIVLELSKKEQRKFSEEFDLRDKIFRYLRAIKGVEVIAILTEHESTKTRVNFRSQGKVDVASLAAKFNGGGHYRASGCMVEGNVAAARKKILSSLKKVLS